jgi:hypothetical protein
MQSEGMRTRAGHGYNCGAKRSRRQNFVRLGGGGEVEHVDGALAVAYEQKALSDKYNTGRSFGNFAGEQTSYRGHSGADL